MTITVANEADVEVKIENTLKKFCSTYDLISVTSSQQGNQLKLTYEIDLKSRIDDFQITNRLIAQINNIDVALTKKAKKKKNL